MTSIYGLIRGWVRYLNPFRRRIVELTVRRRELKEVLGVWEETPLLREIGHNTEREFRFDTTRRIEEDEA